DARDGAAVGRRLPQGGAGHGGRSGFVMGERENTGLAISAVGHLMVLAVLVVVWLFGLMSTKTESTPAIAVDMISDSELSQIMAGIKTAPQANTPKPIVDKI